jgi:uncharacterized protein YbjT (DUF2867 family)
VAETVLVTGGTGFVGGWCLSELLKRGYTVRTTVRSLAKEAAVRAAVAAVARFRVEARVVVRPGTDAGGAGTRLSAHLQLGQGAAGAGLGAATGRHDRR